MLSVDVTKQLGSFALRASFQNDGLVTGLFGASGAGKTSLINLVAGLIKPESGKIVLNDETFDDVSSRIHVAPHRRRIGYVFQDSRLFPHLDVAKNLDYGRRISGLARDPTHEKNIIEMLDIDDLRGRRPSQLSGGERQRVALGRALLTKPKLLLMDEPLGSLDDERKAEIMPYFIRLRDEAKIPMVYVSHDADEMRQLAANIVMLKQGQVIARGGIDLLPK